MAFKIPKPRRAPRFSTPKHAPSTSKKRSSLGNTVSEELAVSEEFSIEDCLTVINKSQYPELNNIANKIQIYAQINNISLDSLSNQKLSTFLKQNPTIGSLLKDMEKILLDIDLTHTSLLKDDRLSLSDFFNIVAEHAKLLPKVKTKNLKEILKLRKKIEFELLELLEGVNANTLYELYKKATKDGTRIIDPRRFEVFLKAFKEDQKNKSIGKTSTKNILQKKPTREMIEIGKDIYDQVGLMIQIDKNMMKDPAKLVKDFIKSYIGSEI